MTNNWKSLNDRYEFADAVIRDDEIQVYVGKEWVEWKGQSWYNHVAYCSRPRTTITGEKKYVIERDGNSWCAYDADTFINLQESTAAFGDTPVLALKALLNKEHQTPNTKRVKSLCWRHEEDGCLRWLAHGLIPSGCYKRFPCGDREGEVLE